MSKRHTQSCRQCKEAIRAVLVSTFGVAAIVEQHRLGLPTTLAGYKNHPHLGALERIDSDLRAYRGFASFGTARSLPPVDFFIESQHFTAPRGLSLSRYPETLELGFDRDTWIDLCSKLDRHDNRPAYRDEQRAWLDTLRDFAPSYVGLRPIVRLYAGATKWCGGNLASGRRGLEQYAPNLIQALTTWR